MEKLNYIIVMKVGPHGVMNLQEIIQSKKEEEKIHGVHFWGYSGVFCQPRPTQEFCKSKESVQLVLIETKSPYQSDIGDIFEYSENGIDYKKFKGPVQLSGAQFSFVARNLREFENFCVDDYIVVGGKNDGKLLSDHLRFRVNKSFAKLDSKSQTRKQQQTVLIADLVEPYCIWLKE